MRVEVRDGVLARAALNLALRAVVFIRALGSSAAQACDAVAHVQQHHLQRIRIHAPLVGLGRTLHVLHHPTVLILRLMVGHAGYTEEKRSLEVTFGAINSLT